MSPASERIRAKWSPRPDRDVRLVSAITIATWACRERGLFEAHRNELLSIASWKATEIDGKQSTRYRTQAVLTAPDGHPLNHDHVIPRRDLRRMMLAHPDSCNVVLTNAVGCLVTKDEHQRLNRTSSFGWRRYVDESIQVVDMADLSLLDLKKANDELQTRLGGLLDALEIS